VAVAALTGAALGLLHAGLTVVLALSQHVSGLGITLLATALSYYGYRVSFPKVSTPPTITPFAPMDWLGIPVLEQQTPLTLLALLAVPGDCLWVAPNSGGSGRAHGGRKPAGRRRPGCAVVAVRTGAIVAGSALMGIAGSRF
jgi:ABC-type uncharacterized transport system permease subunit